jgi:hypothetical protein
MGYGMIIAINIYALVCGLVTKPEFAFFPGEGSSNAFLDLIMKLLVIGGGALTMQKSMALIGNLVASGAGSNELRDNAFSMGSLARMAKGVTGKALGAAGYLTGAKALKSVAGDAVSMQSRYWGAKALSSLGFGGGNSGMTDKNGVKDPDGSSGSKNNEKANYGSNPNSAKDAINDVGFKRAFTGVNTANNNKTDQNKGNTVNNIINNGGNSQTKQQGNGEANQNNQNNNIANPNQQNGGK